MAVRDVVQAAAGNAGGDKLYVEDVFSTYLYTGNGSTQTINNGIDLAGEGGLTWFKARSGTEYHTLFDTERGTSSALYTNIFNAAGTPTNGVTSFNSDGFTLGSLGAVNNPYGIASWTFRKAPKFFDVVTYTGTGGNRGVLHDLGSVPGAIWVKRTDTASDWQCYHRSLGNTKYMVLNTSAAEATSYWRWIYSTPTDAVFFLGNDATVNASGGTYVAYLFAHDAGGFGDDGEQNVVSCGSYLGNGATAGPNINLGYEPQFVLCKNVTSAARSGLRGSNWTITDTMRGMSQTNCSVLYPNLSAVEDSTTATTGFIIPNATGFVDTYTYPGDTYIYIAIRRGPMKTPESGTEVFSPQINIGNGTAKTQSVGFPIDLVITGNTSQMDGWAGDRLRGFSSSGSKFLLTRLQIAEFAATTASTGVMLDGNTTGLVQYTSGSSNQNQNSYSYANWFFRRAPGFFDVVAYTGSNGYQIFSHNLAVIPELIIIKNRTNAQDWTVGAQSVLGLQKYLVLNSAAAVGSNASYFNVSWSNTSFLVDGNLAPINQNGSNYIAYLFASCPGVSKVGSYTGTGTTLAIDCGFSAGARFVLIKRTDSTGDWYVWDTTRGIVSGNDPYLLLNSAAAEVTSTDYIDPSSAGFEISSTAPAAINASGGSYIFLAIA